ncbi:MAG: hypothetical protein GWM90_31970, partial [Gemmatimonadetes bacterium]|nr:hypothetical protein [Gemmatimonadota bacterium]NIQ59894.1 hypothetical protein [Gemmatimonadota bacterium]NIU80087.1 hypothetical protein [Gammaproteobacteria bacterium]NIX48507.1 hypothetical protein [Gemmatimonadota bacterium]
LLHPGSDRAMAVFSALARFVEEYLEPDVPTLSPDVEDRLRRLATDRDRDVR